MSEASTKVAEIMLEDDQPQAAPPEDRRAKWDRAAKSMDELAELHAKRHALEQELAFTIRWSRALAYVDRDPKEAQGIIRAHELGSIDHGLFPHGSPARRIWRTYAQRYPNAVVGAHLKGGGSVLFIEPIPPRGSSVKVPSYEEFDRMQTEKRQRQSDGY